MSYGVYTTEALVIGSFSNNTADKSFLLFTKDAGMLYASARSVREERSKQRYALQDFSLIAVSLIKGKTGWRIGSVETKGNLFADARTREARGSVVRLCKLLRRYVTGEESHPQLYLECIEALTYIAQAEIESRPLVEEIITARVLSALGYIRDVESLKVVVMGSLYDAISLTPVSLLPTLESATAEAISASHL